MRFIEENAQLSGVSASSMEVASCSRPVSPPVGVAQESRNVSTSSSHSRRSLIVSASDQPGVDSGLLRLIADGATRFIHHQIVEIASGKYDINVVPLQSSIFETYYEVPERPSFDDGSVTLSFFK
uniref:Uncharacterized protein n=1 Tax=Parascaris equorum TaxID=6256 RepID=A0A914S116_PAREQ